MIELKGKNFTIKTVANWEEHKKGHFFTTEWKKPIPFSCPPTFGGENLPSPEDLLLAAVATCTLTSILHICDSLHTQPDSLSVTTSTTVQFNKQINDYEFSSIKCSIDISGEKFLLERACKLIPKYCIIKKNIKPEIIYEVKIKDTS